MIYCLSHHHTGTWTALAWLTMHDSVKGLLLEDYVYEVLGGQVVKHQVESGIYEARFDPNMVYHEHLRVEIPTVWTSTGYRSAPWFGARIKGAQLVLLGTHPTLIPMRDPLASLVTYQRWAERDGRADKDATFDPVGHVDGLVALALCEDQVRQFGHVRFACWDLISKMEWEEVYNHLSGIAVSLGLIDQEQVAADVATNMIVNNTAGSYPLKTAYETGDTAALRSGIASGGYDHLVSREEVLRPFLERLGYQDLVWWS